jgi:hypothetical protein
MTTSKYSDYYKRKPDDVMIPKGWEPLNNDWFRKPLRGEYYVNRVGTVATFQPGVLKSNPERIIVRKSVVP